MNEPKTVIANGINLAYFEVGEGPLVLCLHGFPDSPHTWDKLSPVIAALGYKVVMPYMRGYGMSDKPAAGSYHASDLADDVLSLIDVLGYNDAIVVGHDWGALAAYFAANTDPSRISKLITVAIPHPASLKPSLKGLWRSRHFIGFQFKTSARRYMSDDNFAGVDKIYKRWSPNWKAPATELENAKAALAAEGAIDGSLGYYWCFREDGFFTRNNEIGRIAQSQTTVPTLCIVGEADGALDLSIMPDTPACFVADYRYEVLPSAGHFLHRESPDVFSNLVVDFLTPAK